MFKVKSCPSCNRSYSDLSLSFCLEDGSLLSAAYNSDEIQINSSDLQINLSFNETNYDDETLVKQSGEKPLVSKTSKIYISPAKKRELDSWKYTKKQRTKEEYPILDSVPTSDRPTAKWTSSDNVREITFQITGKHTFHAQENLEILREFINNSIRDENKILRRSAMRLGSGIFENYEGVFSFDFQSKSNPTKDSFLEELDIFLKW